MESGMLYVAFFQPRTGNFEHWALYLADHGEDIMFEVAGSHPDFQRNVLKMIPEDSSDFIDKLFVGMISPNVKHDLHQLINETRVDNDTVEWDCQDYVLEILDRLEEEFILDKDDEEYIEARKELMEKRGAIH